MVLPPKTRIFVSNFINLLRRGCEKSQFCRQSETSLKKRASINSSKVQPCLLYLPERFDSFWIKPHDLPEPMSNQPPSVKLSRLSGCDVSGNVLTSALPIAIFLCKKKASSFSNVPQVCRRRCRPSRLFSPLN